MLNKLRSGPAFLIDAIECWWRRPIANAAQAASQVPQPGKAPIDICNPALVARWPNSTNSALGSAMPASAQSGWGRRQGSGR